ncbi:hypothetical protein [Hymenobacter sp. HDW8]|uniref:hypothetical protein n=1 Tax=Hymenobacter sp. HDW8 TaxID=2714932 RepID=UPI00140B0C70|nr:hypothetical protein [Hymenobacter sp. HDW8]QIL78358.1 hypothetical protein G7064_21320 [Hymenobacter sp. HDW8]
MLKKHFFGFVLFAGLSATCTPGVESESVVRSVPVEGIWEGQSCYSVETNGSGRQVSTRTDLYEPGRVVCEFTPTEVLHYQGGKVLVRARYTRTPTGFHREQGQGLGAVRIPGDSGNVTIDSLTTTRLVVRQALPWSDTTTLTSIITYSRVARTTGSNR